MKTKTMDETYGDGSDLKNKLSKEGFESYEKIVQLKLTSIDGKKYATDCTNIKTAYVKRSLANERPFISMN